MYTDTKNGLEANDLGIVTIFIEWRDDDLGSDDTDETFEYDLEPGRLTPDEKAYYDKLFDRLERAGVDLDVTHGLFDYDYDKPEQFDEFLERLDFWGIEVVNRKIEHAQLTLTVANKD